MLAVSADFGTGNDGFPASGGSSGCDDGRLAPRVVVAIPPARWGAANGGGSDDRDGGALSGAW